MKIKNQLIITFGVLVALIFVTVGVNFQVYNATDNVPTFVNYSGRLRATSYRLGFLGNMIAHDQDNKERREELNETMGIFDNILASIKEGNSELGLEKLDYQPSIDKIDHIGQIWENDFKVAYASILSSGDQEAVDFVNNEVEAYTRLINEMVTEYSEYSKGKIVKAKIFNGILSVIALLVGIISFYFLNKGINRPIGFLTENLKALSAGGGDLTRRIKATSKDEIAQMTHYFNDFLKNIHGIVLDISDVSSALSGDMGSIANTTEELTKSTEMIAMSAMDVADGSSMQNNQLEELNLLAANLKNDINQVSQKASATLKASEESQQSVEAGNHQVNSQARELNDFADSIKEASYTVEDLNQSSQEIKAMVELIQNISSQTNLLALNASIEAARAGEAGRGFAVVADEIRILAEETDKSATQINQIVASINDNTSNVKLSMDELVDKTKLQESSMENLKNELREILNRSTMTLEESQGIMEISSKVSHEFNTITSSVIEIQSVAVNNSNNTQDVASAVEEQTAAFEEVSANINSIDEMTNRLNAIVGQFEI